MAISSNPDTARPTRTLTSSATSARTAAHRDSIRARTRRPRGAAGQVRDLWHASLHRHMMVDDQAGRPGLEVHLVAERSRQAHRPAARPRAPGRSHSGARHAGSPRQPPGQGRVPEGSVRSAGQGRRRVRTRSPTGGGTPSRSGQLPSPARAGRPHVGISTLDGRSPSSRKLPCFGAVATTRDDALRTLAPDRASTGHVWITIWRRHGLNPFRIFWQPIESAASGLVTGGGAASVSPGVSPGLAPPSGRIAQFSHISCGQPPAPMTSPGLG